MKKIAAFLIIALVVSSCGNGFDTQAKVDEVLNVHDEVMPKMGELMNLKRQILAKAEGETDSIMVKDLRMLAQDLDEAQQGMMVWMREWSKSSAPHVKEESEIEERKAFFTAEIEKVTQVKEAINGSIAEAKEALK